MKLSEFVALDKYPYANERIKGEVVQKLSLADTIVERIYNDPTLTPQAKKALAYEQGVKVTAQIAEAIHKSINERQMAIKALEGKLKSRELAKLPQKETLLSVVYQGYKDGKLGLKEALGNDKVAAAMLELQSVGLIDEDIGAALDRHHSSEILQAIETHKAMIEQEWKLIEQLRSYEVEGLKEDEAKEIIGKRFKDGV